MTDNDALPPEHLFVPEWGLRTGCQLLAELLTWAGTKTTDQAKVTLAALAAYNGGRGGNDPTKNWPLRNARYANEVLAKLAELKKAGV
jgi:soluble lytic murein transglycosylase-like protein